MAKQADVEFRIRSKDLSAKSIEKITQELQELINTQERQRQQAAASSQTIKSLEDDYRKLGTTLRDISARRNLVESLIGKRGDLDAAKRRVAEVRVELAELLSMRSRGTFLGDIDKAIGNVRRSLKGAERDFNTASAVVDKLEKNLQSLGVDANDAEKSLRDLAGAQDQVVVAQARTEQAIRETNTALQRQQAATLEAAEAKRQAAIAEQQYQRELAETNRQQQQRTARRADAEAAFTNNQAVARQQTLARDAALRQMEIQRRADAVERRLADTRRQLAGATSNLANSTDRARGAQNLFNDSGRKSLSFLQRQRGQLLSLASAYFGVFEAINVGRKAIETDIQRQGALIRLQVATGSIAEAGEEFAFVRKEADRLGQSLTPLANQYSKFKIAAEGAGQSAETTRQVFVNFSEAATVLQLSQENVEGIFRALEQSFSKGIVQAEELRGQLGDRLPGAFTKLATAIGVSNAELTKLLEQGEVSANVLPLLGEFIADEVASSLPAATRNTRAELERLKTAFDDFLVTIANSGFSDTIRRLAVDLRTFFQSSDGKKFAQDLALSFSTVVKVISSVISILGGPSGIIAALKILVAINVARWAGQFAASIGVAVRQLAVMRTAMAATTVSAKTMGRAIGLALGPIAVAVTLAAEAFMYFEARAEAAADAAEEQANKIEELNTAHGEALDGLIQLNEKELEAEKQAYDVANAKRAEASARLANARAALAELKAQGGLVTRSRGEFFENPEAVRLSKAVADAEKEILDLNNVVASHQAKMGRTQKARARAEKEAAQANESATRRVAALQTELSDANNQKRLKDDKQYYNEFVGRLRALNRDVNEIPNARINATLEDSLDRLNQTSARVRASIAGVNLDKGDDKASKKAAKEAERLARERERAENKRLQVADKTKEALLEIDSELAQARIENDATTVAQVEANQKQQLAIIDAEIAKRRSDLEAIKREAEKFGSPESLKQVTEALGKLDELQRLQTSRSNTDSRQKALEVSEKRVNDLIAQRNAQIEIINIEKEAGLRTEVEAQELILEQRRQYAESIRQSVQDVLALIAAIEQSDPDLAKKLNLEAVKAEMQGISTEATTLLTRSEQLTKQFNEDFASGVTDAFGTLATGIAGAILQTNSLSDAFSSAADAFLNFAADFLVNIGKMILQAILLKALQNSNMFSGLSGFVSGVMHNGGMVGSPRGSTRSVSPLAFIGAPRYHSGGFPGLRSDEIPIIAQRGEEMLSRNDPRNSLNGGASAPQQVKIINAIDSSSVVSEAMNRRDGQNAVVNMIRARKQEIKNLLGV